MVDVESRRRAAEVIEKFRDGKISNFEFEEMWPTFDRLDRGLKAIKTMLWRFYDDRYEHMLTEGHHEVHPEGQHLFERCVLFLRTDFEYAWPKDNFIGIGGLGVFGRILTFGLSSLLDRGLRRRAEREFAEMRIIGSNAIWPFATGEQYVTARQRAGAGPGE